MQLSRPAGATASPGSATAGELRISRQALLITGITVVAAALRFATLTSQSLWFDEAQAVHEMRLSFGGMLHAWSAGEPNPPLYFVLAWVWAQVFGAGAGGLRALSAVLGTVTIPVTYLAGKELVSRRAGTFAAAFAALNPFLIWYSQEAREYMLLTALSAASVLFFARAWHGRSRHSDLAWWTVVSALALLTQYFAGFLVAAAGLLLLYRLRNRAVVAALAVLAVVEAATVPHLLGHVSHPKLWIMGAGSLSVRVRQVPVAFAAGTLYRGVGALGWSLLGAALLAALVIALLVAAGDERDLRGAGLGLVLGGVVVVVPLLVALAGRDYYEFRALIPAWVPLALVVAAACAVPRARAWGGALALLLCGTFVWATVTIDTGSAAYRRPDWRGVAQALGRARSTRAIAAFDGTFATAPLAVYLPGVPWTGTGAQVQTPQTSQAPVTVDEIDVVGNVGQTAVSSLPAGTRLISSRSVDGGYVVDRFALAAPARLTPADLEVSAARLTGSPTTPTGMLIQYKTG